MIEPRWQAPIAVGCEKMDLEVEPAMLDLLSQLVDLIEKWGKVYNLTAVRKPQEMVTRHILDSLVMLPFIGDGRLLDVGCGAGLPGLPIAIVKPQLAVTLLDSSSKKLRFVRQAVGELGLTNVEVAHARMREYQSAQSFDMVISRAVASMDELYQQTDHLLRVGGEMLFMKGTYPHQELETFSADRNQLQVTSLDVPGLNAARHLIRYKKTGSEAQAS